jgi:hypothetical protein
MKKNLSYGFISLLAILILTNPGFNDFKVSEYVIGSDSQYKVRNYFIFSTYTTYFNRGTTNYVGVLGNFFEGETYISATNTSIH